MLMSIWGILDTAFRREAYRWKMYMAVVALIGIRDDCCCPLGESLVWAVVLVVSLELGEVEFRLQTQALPSIGLARGEGIITFNSV